MNIHGIRSLITSSVLLGSALAAPTRILDQDGAGIGVRRGAVVLYGNAANCSQPGSVVFKRLQRSTIEWRTIRSKGVRKGTARYDLLFARMNARVRKAVRAAADAGGFDCVVCKRDIVDARGLRIRDLTADVKGRLGTVKIAMP